MIAIIGAALGGIMLTLLIVLLFPKITAVCLKTFSKRESSELTKTDETISVVDSEKGC